MSIMKPTRDDLQDRIRDLENDKEELEMEKRDFQDKIRKREREYAAACKAITQLQHIRQDKMDEIFELDEQNKKLKKDLEQARDETEKTRHETAKIIEEYEQGKDNLEAKNRLLEDEIKDLKEENIRNARKEAE